MCYNCGKPDNMPCGCFKTEAFCDTCLENKECDELYNAECVIYNYKKPKSKNKLKCLDLPNGVNVHDFMEEVDKWICYFQSCEYVKFLLDKNAIVWRGRWRR